jgi:hypothetical protein
MDIVLLAANRRRNKAPVPAGSSPLHRRTSRVTIYLTEEEKKNYGSDVDISPFEKYGLAAICRQAK